MFPAKLSLKRFSGENKTFRSKTYSLKTGLTILFTGKLLMQQTDFQCATDRLYLVKKQAWDLKCVFNMSKNGYRYQRS